MLSKEAFINVLENYIYFHNRNKQFEKDLGKIFGAKYKPTDEYSTIEENQIWFNWAITGVDEIIKEIILDFGETQEGAEYWLYEGIDMITKDGGTTITENETEYKITDFSDLYDYLITLKK